MNAKQSILVTFGKESELGLALPMDQLPLASALIAAAKIVKPDNCYKTEPTWELSDALPVIRVMDAGAFEEPSAALVEARKAADENNSRWATEYTAHQSTKKLLDEARAQVEALAAAGTCRAPVTEDDPI